MISTLPKIGNKVKCKVLKTEYFQAILNISTPICNYRAVMKSSSTEEYLCDKLIMDSEIDCVIVGYSDMGIIVVPE